MSENAHSMMPGAASDLPEDSLDNEQVPETQEQGTSSPSVQTGDGDDTGATEPEEPHTII